VTRPTSPPWSTPSPDDRRVKIIVLTDAGRAVATEIDEVLSVPPSAFSALSHSELRQLRDLLDKILVASDRSAPGDETSGIKVSATASS
jgi:hypothetical protein